MPGASLTELVSAALVRADDLERLARGWARAAPLVALVPAFGLKALPAPARGTLGVVFGLAVMSQMPALSAVEKQTPWALVLGLEVLSGIPLAIATAVPLWAATSAGGLIGSLYAERDALDVQVVPFRTGPTGVLFSLLSSFLFLASGGAARCAAALGSTTLSGNVLATSAARIAAGIALSVHMAAPILVSAVFLDTFGALLSRAATPAHIQTAVTPLKTLGLLAVLGVLFERISALML
jgi:type III secretory pathway component EscT